MCFPVLADRAGKTSYDERDFAEQVCTQFSQKWGTHRLQDRANIREAVLAHDGAGIEVDSAVLLDAFERVKRKSKVDHYGVSVAAVQIIATALPLATAQFFATTIASTEAMSAIVFKGRVFGKESSITPATSLRSILPLPAVMQVLDVLLPTSLEAQLGKLLSQVPECFIGARPRTQCLGTLEMPQKKHQY